MSKKAKKDQKKVTNFNIGVYRCLENKTLSFPYGQITFKQNDMLVMPHFIPVQKSLDSLIEGKFKIYTPGTNLNNKSLLVMRYGGIGDILCIMPALVELKNQFPTCKIGLMCSPANISILHNFPDILDGAVNNIVEYKSIKHFDYFMSLENTLEISEDLDKDIHQTYADSFGITLDDMSIEKTIAINQTFQKTDQSSRYGIGIQYKTNAVLRDYDLDKTADLINLLNEKFPQEPIFLLGKPDDYLNVNYLQAKTGGRFIPNGCGRDSLDLMKVFDQVSRLKVVIAPDSSMIHFAGFNKTPIIGLYGPFPSKTRLNRYHNAIGLDGKTECSPCHRHNPLAWCPWTSARGLCLSAITPEVIADHVSKFI